MFMALCVSIDLYYLFICSVVVLDSLHLQRVSKIVWDWSKHNQRFEMFRAFQNVPRRPGFFTDCLRFDLCLVLLYVVVLSGVSIIFDWSLFSKASVIF